MKATAIFIVFFLTGSCYGQEKRIPLSNWEIHGDSTNYDTIDLSGLNEWEVYAADDTVFVKKRIRNTLMQLPFELVPTPYEERMFMGRRAYLEVQNGYLVAFNHGEFGGTLYWFSKNGKERYQIAGINIQQFILRKKKIYAIAGLSHISNSFGKIVEISIRDKKWQMASYLELPSAPFAVILDKKNNFLIAADSSLLMIEKGKQNHTLIPYSLWPPVRANSMLIMHDNIYIGMREVVVLYNLRKSISEWLTPLK